MQIQGSLGGRTRSRTFGHYAARLYPDSSVRRNPSYVPPTAGTLLRYLYPLTEERAKRDSNDSAAGSSTLVSKYVLANTTVDQPVQRYSPASVPYLSRAYSPAIRSIPNFPNFPASCNRAVRQSVNDWIRCFFAVASADCAFRSSRILPTPTTYRCCAASSER